MFINAKSVSSIHKSDFIPFFHDKESDRGARVMAHWGVKLSSHQQLAEDHCSDSQNSHKCQSLVVSGHSRQMSSMEGL